MITQWMKVSDMCRVTARVRVRVSVIASDKASGKKI
jgi:hypothetical protein